MARTKAQLPVGARLADYLTVGYLAMRYPIGKVRETFESRRATAPRRSPARRVVSQYDLSPFNRPKKNSARVFGSA